MAGAIISQVAENMPGKIGKLVYLAAYLSKNGESVTALSKKDTTSSVGPALEFNNDYSLATIKSAVVHDRICADCPAYMKDLLVKYHRAEPVKGLNDKVILTARFATVPKYYIATTKDRVVPYSLQLQMIKTHGGFKKVFELPTSHLPFVTMPQEFIDILSSITVQLAAGLPANNKVNPLPYDDCFSGKMKLLQAMKSTHLAVLLLLTLLNRSIAQLNENDTAKCQLRISVTGNYQQGNVELLNIKTKIDLLFRSGNRCVFKSQNNHLYQAVYNKKADNDVFSRNWWYYQPERQLYPFAIAYIAGNFRRKIDLRYFAGAGLTYRILQTRNHQLKLSASAVYEQTRFAGLIYNEPHYNGSSRITAWQATC